MPASSAAEGPSLRSSTLVVLGVWTLLACAGPLSAWVGRELALTGCFGAAAAISLLARPRPWRAPIGARAIAATGLGGVAGYAGFAAWTSVVAFALRAFGFDLGDAALPSAAGPALTLALVLFGPVFEEALYRGRLLSALRRHVGWPGAVLASSAVFAVSHLEPRAAVATFLVGCALGVTMLAGRSLGLCIGIHVGLNAAALLCGVPAVRWAPSAEASALLGPAALVLALFVARGAGPRSPAAALWRNRLVSAAIVVAVVTLARELVPDPRLRGEVLYRCVVILGFGHLLGGALLARGRMREKLPRGVPPALAASFAWTGIAGLLALYTWLLAVAPSAFVPLLVVSTWHTVENDLALRRSYARGRSSPISRGLDDHLLALGWTSLLSAIFVGSGLEDAIGPALDGSVFERPSAAPAKLCAGIFGALLLARNGRSRRGRRGAALVACAALLPSDLSALLSFPDAFALFGLYHLVSWVVLLTDRMGRRPRDQRKVGVHGEAARLLAVHGVPAAGCLALLLLPEARLGGLRDAVFSPVLYLFWSVLHVAQTAWVRGLEPPRRN